MCGIFGIIGEETQAQTLLEGLKRLEYRGYDSWGIALAGRGKQLDWAKDAGRVPDTTEGAGFTVSGTHSLGIAHTRWATHGEPNGTNAHPHFDSAHRFAVVHNGIIENYRSLARELEAEGISLQSQTDSEVIVHFIAHYVGRGQSFVDAVFSTLSLLEGTYGVVAFDSHQPDLLIGARSGSPLVLGIGEATHYLASDPTALVGHTSSVVYLDDGDVVIISGKSYETRTMDRSLRQRSVESLDLDLPSLEKGNFDHFMLKEIYEQPDSFANTMRGRLIRSEGRVKLGGVDDETLRTVERVHLLGCGTSWHAALVGKYMIEELARLPATVSYAAEFRYSNPVIERGTLVIPVSQSGETADTLAALREAKLLGADLLGVVNVVGSTIAREAGKGVFIHAGPEIGVASTKAFTGQLITLALIALSLGRVRGLSLHNAITWINALEQLPQQVQGLLDRGQEIRNQAQIFDGANHALYLGRHAEFPVALEGALKLKEISYIHAEGINAAELKHGPLALVDQSMPVVAVASGLRLRDKMLSSLQEVKARGGELLVVASQPLDELAMLTDKIIEIPQTLDLISPALSVVPLQLLAYEAAVNRGCDVDKPRNLAKSVTVE